MDDADLLPLFPLTTVLFPNQVLPLHVFEERYRQLLAEHRSFGVVLLRGGWEVGELGDLHPVGTVASVVARQELAEGRLFVVTRGTQRFRIKELDRGHPYLRARVEPLADAPNPPAPRVRALVERYLAAHGVAQSELVEASAQAGPMVWLAGAVLQTDEPLLQVLLETGDPDLAERYLRAELRRLEGVGPLAPVRPHPESPN